MDTGIDQDIIQKIKPYINQGSFKKVPSMVFSDLDEIDEYPHLIHDDV